MGADFSGYATKAGLKCTDGRTITPEAFKHQDKLTVPLVWQHGHNSPDNVLGHAVLEARADGIYCYGYFNNTKAGQAAKQLVEHKDIDSLSIYANQLVEKNSIVHHGDITEVSLVLKGANKGAKIDFVAIQHGDGEFTELADEAVINMFIPLEISHAEGSVAPTSGDGPTIEEVYNSMSPLQQDVVHYLVGLAADPDGDGDNDAEVGVQADNDASHSDSTSSTPSNTDGEGDLEHQEGSTTVGTTNVFEAQAAALSAAQASGKHVLSHADGKAIIAAAQKPGATLRSAIEDYALAHNIEPVDVLFPNFGNLDRTPQFLTRRMEWVQGVLDSVSHTPFSRVRSIIADITMDQARAKGYVKSSLKQEEFFSLTKRTTSPTTIYKKQKLDRDDILDITDFDVVMWLKAEMQMMLKEEIARAILIGDGRQVTDPDKIKDPAAITDGIGIRSILNEHELYATTVNVNLLDASSSYQELIDAVVLNMRFYKGTGAPVFYTTLPVISQLLLLKDTLGRRLYDNKADIAAAMMVSDIVAVEAMENSAYAGLVGIIVNLADYSIGTDKGGEVNMFDFFDLDYNQQKYLMETRMSGALTRLKSALIIHQQAGTDTLIASVTAPTMVTTTGVVTIPTQANVTYKNEDTGATLSSGAQTALAIGASLNVVAVPAAGYYFPTNQVWRFTRLG